MHLNRTPAQSPLNVNASLPEEKKAPIPPSVSMRTTEIFHTHNTPKSKTPPQSLFKRFIRWFKGNSTASSYTSNHSIKWLVIGNLVLRKPLPKEMVGEKSKNYIYPLVEQTENERLKPEKEEKIKSAAIQILDKLFKGKEVKEGTVLQKGEQIIEIDGKSRILKKTDLSIILIAFLKEGTKESIAQANALIPQMTAIMNTHAPGKKSGSVYDNTPDDFSISHLTIVLCLDAEQKNPNLKLSREAKTHLLKELLLFEGGEFDMSAPNSIGAGIAVRETENHLLMGRGSAHLKNQFLIKNPDIAEELGYNVQNLAKEAANLETKLSNFIQNIIDAGPFEFNSKPYVEPTIRALSNLSDFADEPIKSKAMKALDTIFYLHATGSLNHLSYAPSRRRVNKSEPEALSNYLTLYASSWSGKPTPSQHNEKLTFHALCTKYRPKIETMELMQNKGKPGTSSFDRIGHGFKPSSFFDSMLNWISYKTIRSCPEIYSSGKTQENSDYLLSAGGVARTGIVRDGWASDIYSRLTCLLTGNSTQIQDTFYLGDPIDDENIKTLEAVKLRKIDKDLTNGEIDESRAEELKTTVKAQARAEATDAVLKKAQKRNNTGVYKHFACGACRVNVPKNQEILAKTENWILYKANKGLYVAVHNSQHKIYGILNPFNEKKWDLGVMALFDLKDSQMDTPEKREDFLKHIENANSNPHELKTAFKFPEGESLTYDIFADESEWVIKKVNGVPLNRDYESWPLLTTEKKAQ